MVKKRKIESARKMKRDITNLEYGIKKIKREKVERKLKEQWREETW